MDTGSLTSLTQSDIDALPAALQKATLYNENTYSDGTGFSSVETTYFDANGVIIGNKHVNIDNWGTNTGYNDANGNWLGGGWSDSEGNSGSNMSYDLAVSAIVTSDDVVGADTTAFGALDFGAFPGDATVLSEAVFTVDGANAGTAWPGGDVVADAAAITILTDLLAAQPTLVGDPVTSATYVDGNGNQMVITYDGTSEVVTGIAITDITDPNTPVPIASQTADSVVAMTSASVKHADMVGDTTAVAANKVILSDLLAAAPTVAADGTTSTHTATTAGKDYSLVVTYDANGDATGVVITNVTDTASLATVTIDPLVTALKHSDLYNDATNILTSVTDTALLAVINDSANFPSTPTMLKVETGSNSWSYDENGDGTIQDSEKETSSFKYVYAVESSGAWTLVSGVETHGGSTSEYGFNWSGGTTTTDITASGFTAMTDADLLVNATDYLSKQFIESQFPNGSVEFTDGTAGATPGTAVTDIVPRFVDSNTDTLADVPVYADVNKFPWGGEEITYYDASGTILGYVNKDSWDTGEVDGNGNPIYSTNISYSDANFNWLGNTYSDQYGSGSSFTVEVTLASNDPLVTATDSDFTDAGITAPKPMM